MFLLGKKIDEQKIVSVFWIDVHNVIVVFHDFVFGNDPTQFGRQ